jgi:hypothetical protein
VITDPLNRNEPEECCNRPAHLKNPYCLEIHIPADDYFYSLFGLRCQDFVRGFPAVRPGCRLGKQMYQEYAAASQQTLQLPTLGFLWQWPEKDGNCSICQKSWKTFNIPCGLNIKL